MAAHGIAITSPRSAEVEPVSEGRTTPRRILLACGIASSLLYVVLVRGRPNALQVAGKAGGWKLRESRRLAAKGHRVTIIGEAQFWKLADVAGRSRRKSRSRPQSRRPRSRH